MKFRTIKSFGLFLKMLLVLQIVVISIVHLQHQNRHCIKTIKVLSYKTVFLVITFLSNLSIYSLDRRDLLWMHVFIKMHIPIIFISPLTNIILLILVFSIIMSYLFYNKEYNGVMQILGRSPTIGNIIANHILGYKISMSFLIFAISQPKMLLNIYLVF